MPIKLFAWDNETNIGLKQADVSKLKISIVDEETGEFKIDGVTIATSIQLLAVLKDDKHDDVVEVANDDISIKKESV